VLLELGGSQRGAKRENRIKFSANMQRGESGERERECDQQLAYSDQAGRSILSDFAVEPN